VQKIPFTPTDVEIILMLLSVTVAARTSENTSSRQ
jgi:hypothetical protein